MASIPHPEPILRGREGLLLAGLRWFHGVDETEKIKAQWERFAPWIGRTPQQKGAATYGVCLLGRPDRHGFDYLAAVEVHAFDDLPEELAGVRIKEQDYAIFPHDGFIATLPQTCRHAMRWTPPEPFFRTQGPVTMIEHYAATFDLAKPGGMEVWIPVTRA